MKTQLQIIKEKINWLKASICLVLIPIFSFMCPTLTAQTYSVGDTINNFGTSICANDGGFEDSYWEYNVDGRHKITWINLFTTW
jgi:hypothetical protein